MGILRDIGQRPLSRRRESDYFTVFTVLGGNRNRTDANVNNVSSNGNYWSSEVVGGASQNAYNLNFNAGTDLNRANNNNRANGFGVRCARNLLG